MTETRYSKSTQVFKHEVSYKSRTRESSRKHNTNIKICDKKVPKTRAVEFGACSQKGKTIKMIYLWLATTDKNDFTRIIT